MPRRKWTAKDERQYEHVRESEIQRGRDEDRAEEVAARTVNKQRRLERRTPNVTTQGTGNPNTPLDQRSRDELRNRARQLNIRGRSRMTKAELLEALRSR